MGAEDIQRIDGLLIKICKTIDERSPEVILASSPRGFNTVLNISDEDLNFLRRQKAVTVKTQEELTAEYGVKPEECGQLAKREGSFSNDWCRLGEEIDQLKKRLSWPYRLMSRRAIISQRERELGEKEVQISAVRASIDELRTVYSAVARYILTDKGIYASLKPKIRRYVDLNFQPMQIRSSGNSLNGRIVLFHFEGGLDIWDEESSYTPAQYGEAFKLNMQIPYKGLTEIDGDRTTPEQEFGKKVTGRIKDCIDTFIKGRSGPISVDYLDFLDRRFWVMIHPTSANVHKDEKNKIGTTTVTDYVSDFGPQGYHHESRTVDLYTRIVEGDFKFDLTFERVNSQGQSFRR